MMGENLNNKLRIAGGLFDLLKVKEFEEISVMELCTYVNISRQTFYRTFTDKYEVATWYISNLVDASCRGIGTERGWRDSFLDFFTLIEKNPKVFSKLHESIDYNAPIASFAREFAENLTDTYLRRYGAPLTDLLSFQLKWFAPLSGDVILEWAKAGCVPESRTFVDYYLSLVPRELFDAFDLSPSEENPPPSVFACVI